MARNFVAGLIASSVGVVFATPFDMVKSRFQGEKYGPDRKWKSVAYTIKYAYQNEGGYFTFSFPFPNLCRRLSSSSIL